MRAPSPFEQLLVLAGGFLVGHGLAGLLQRRQEAAPPLRSVPDSFEYVPSVQDYDPMSPDGVPLPPVRENVYRMRAGVCVECAVPGGLHMTWCPTGRRNRYGAGNPRSN